MIQGIADLLVAVFEIQGEWQQVVQVLGSLDIEDFLVADLAVESQDIEAELVVED